MILRVSFFFSNVTYQSLVWLTCTWVECALSDTQNPYTIKQIILNEPCCAKQHQPFFSHPTNTFIASGSDSKSRTVYYHDTKVSTYRLFITGLKIHLGNLNDFFNPGYLHYGIYLFENILNCHISSTYNTNTIQRLLPNVTVQLTEYSLWHNPP